MKHISKLAFVLMILAMMAFIVPSVFASVTNPTDCPAGTHAVDIGDGLYDCTPDPTETPPTCTTGFDCAGDPCEFGCLPPPTCTGITSMNANISEHCETPVPGNNHPASTPVPAHQGNQDTISFNDSDLGVTLFVGHDENDAPVLQLYETQNETTNGNFAVTITQNDLAPYVGNLPSANVLLKSAGHIRVFVLTTGEIAVFVGPDSEGKMHIKIFDGIPWTHVTSLTIDPV